MSWYAKKYSNITQVTYTHILYSNYPEIRDSVQQLYESENTLSYITPGIRDSVRYICPYVRD